MTKKQEAHLRLYSKDTYSIKLPYDVGEPLEKAGYVQWVPSWMPGGFDYALTEKGRAWLGFDK